MHSIPHTLSHSMSYLKMFTLFQQMILSTVTLDSDQPKHTHSNDQVECDWAMQATAIVELILMLLQNHLNYCSSLIQFNQERLSDLLQLPLSVKQLTMGITFASGLKYRITQKKESRKFSLFSDLIVGQVSLNFGNASADNFKFNLIGSRLSQIKLFCNSQADT